MDRVKLSLILLSYGVSLIFIFFRISLSLRLDLYFLVDTNDTIRILNITTSWRDDKTSFLPEGSYSIQVLSKDDKILYQRKFHVDFFILSDPPTRVEENTLTFSIPFSPDIKSLKITKDGKILLDENIRKYFCNDNSICDSNENFYTCPSDCPSGFKDGVCDGMIDGRCDPDCDKDLDLDCNPLLKETILGAESGEGVVSSENETNPIFDFFKNKKTLTIVALVLLILVFILIVVVVLKYK
jgi:hypothetical protein